MYRTADYCASASLGLCDSKGLPIEIEVICNLVLLENAHLHRDRVICGSIVGNSMQVKSNDLCWFKGVGFNYADLR